MDETRQLFFNENENIIEYFYTNKVPLSDIARSNIKEISKKASNNLIGYYQFKDKNLYYKIYILPKIYKISDHDDINKDYFFSFVKKYYELKREFPNINPKTINSNIIDLSFDSNFTDDNVNNMDDLIELKYIDALKTIIRFFKQHNQIKSKVVSYSSQSIKHKLNLAKNIRELDKSKIHQDKNISVIYSKLSFITISSLDFFLRHRVLAVSTDSKEIKKLANQAKNLINKRFISDKNFLFKTKEITKDKISRLFKKNNEYKKLYDALITILGAEYYSSGSNKKETTKINHMTTLYFDPALLYEWYVYKKIKTTDEYFSDVNDYSIKFDKINSETSLSYSITSGSIYNSERTSNPDYILENDDIQIIIDAKWKVFDNDSAESHGLKMDDVIKLQRDVEIRKDPASEKQIRAVLIYPKVLDSYRNQTFKVRYPSNRNIFEFKVIEVPYML